jgi:hypothetical protein
MKEVLIISYNFPPLEDIAARRYGLMVEYMEEFGYRPLVLTTRASGSFPVRIPESQIIRVGEQKQKSARIDNKNERFKIPKYLEALKKIPGISNWRIRSYDRSMFSWYREVQSKMDYILPRLNLTKVIIASFSPATALWVGRSISRKTKIPWLADFRDLGALRRDGRDSIAWFIDRKLESVLLKDAAGIISVSKHFANYLAQHYLKKTTAILNGWDIKTFQQFNSLSKDKLDKFSYLYHAGRFYPHRMEAVRMLLDVISEMPSINLKIRSLGPIDLEEDIQRLVAERGIKERVEILAPCSVKQVAKETAESFVNVVFEGIEKKDDWSQGWLTGKFLELLPYSPPVLSIARNDNEMGLVLTITEKGKVCNQVDEIKDFLTGCLKDSNQYKGKKEAVYAYSKENQTKKLCSFIDKILTDS